MQDAHRRPLVAPSGMTDWGRDGQDSSGATLAQCGRVGCETPGSAHMEMPRGSWTPSLELRGALLEKEQTGWEPPPPGGQAVWEGYSPGRERGRQSGRPR